MEKYVKVDWPESQEWMELAHYDSEYGIYECPGLVCFVPEELYNQVTAVEEPTIPDEKDPIWDEYVGMPEESKPWFMKNNALNNE